MKRTFLVSGLLLAVVAWTTILIYAQTNSKPSYEVYAIRYAVLPDFSVAGLVKGADPSRKLDIAMMVWLVKGNGRNILVDSGFYRDQFFKQWKVKDFVRPSDAVAQAGVKPEEITDVIITHMHWDHADGMDLFPKAKIWIQKDEYTYYTGEAWQQPRTHGGIDPDDVMAIVKLNLQGRVGLVNGDGQEIIPGIVCYRRQAYLAVTVCKRGLQGRKDRAGQ
jgi:glyoxylase-like metal-dependent hydrolase (beta-lactamase superfamily II)